MFGTDDDKRDEKYKALYDIWKSGGSPYINLGLQKGSEFGSYKLHDSPVSRMNLWDIIGMHEKARTIFPDTLFIKPGYLGDFFGEIAHGEQFKDTGPIKSLQMHQRRWAESKRYGKTGQYWEPGTLEYEAHMDIEPSIEDAYYNKFPQVVPNWFQGYKPPIIKDMESLKDIIKGFRRN